MSILYLTPVGGEMQLHDLDKCVEDRVAFLRALVTGNELFYSQYLLEGSPYDNAGHFTLSIVVCLADNAQLSQLVRSGELKLLQRRISYMKPLSLRQFAKKVLKYINNLKLSEPYIECIRDLCTHLQLSHIAQHILNSDHADECSRHSINVHFTRCLPLVATRKVEISNGIATVPCGLWKKYLSILYKEHLSSRDSLQKELQVLRYDERIMSIVSRYRKYRIDSLAQNSEESRKIVLRSGDVDNASAYFPPCMTNLHQRFREHHRLSHDQRFFYTCFLKDIGMPVNEAIEFWKSEYEHPSHSSACQHTWAKDSAKFIHGIRHMYGLEGARKSYSCAGCTKIQSSSGSRAEGGCPFKDFSDENRNSVLKPAFVQNSQFMATITGYKSSNNYSKACSFYLQNVFSKTETNLDPPGMVFLSPVKFYHEAFNAKS